MTGPSDVAGDQIRPSRALAGAVAGVLAAAVAMGAAQFAAGLGVPQSSPVLAVGQAAIDLTPPQVKDFAVSAFGADDKTVLLGGILVVLAASAAVLGRLAVRRLGFGMWGLAIFASIGLAAALTRPAATVGYVVPTLVGSAAGAFALTWLVRAAARLGAAADVLFPFDLHPELTDPAQPADPARSASPAADRRTVRTRPSAPLGSTITRPAFSSARSSRLRYPESRSSRARSRRTSLPSGPISQSSRACPSGRSRDRNASFSAPARCVTVRLKLRTRLTISSCIL